jgi:hypothetical protein
MMKHVSLVIFTLTCAAGVAAAELRPAASATAHGLGVNMPLVARVTGAGNTLYITSLDVTNHATFDVQVDFYLDATNQRTQDPITITGSVTRDGLVEHGAGVLRGRANVHFSDFFASLVSAGRLPSSALSDGILGSVLFVFNGLTRSGQGAVTARFRSDLAGGTVGVALRGREITRSEPQHLVAAIRDSSGNTRGEPKLYPNLFINHTGLTPAGAPTTDPVTVELRAVSNNSGQGIGVPVSITIGSGKTATIGAVLQTLQIPGGSEETILVFARVTSGNGAIHGVVSQVDNTTRDGSVYEMSRAD